MIKEKDIQIGFTFRDSANELCIVHNCTKQFIHYTSEGTKCTTSPQVIVRGLKDGNYKHIKYGDLNCFPLEGYINTEGLTEADVQKYIGVLELLGFTLAHEVPLNNLDNYLVWEPKNYGSESNIHLIDYLQEYKDLFKEAVSLLDIKIGFRFKNSYGNISTVIDQIDSDTFNVRTDYNGKIYRYARSKFEDGFETNKYELLEPLELVLPEEGILLSTNPALIEILATKDIGTYHTKKWITGVSIPKEDFWIAWDKNKFWIRYTGIGCLQFNNIYKLLFTRISNTVSTSNNTEIADVNEVHEHFTLKELPEEGYVTIVDKALQAVILSMDSNFYAYGNQIRWGLETAITPTKYILNDILNLTYTQDMKLEVGDSILVGTRIQTVEFIQRNGKLGIRNKKHTYSIHKEALLKGTRLVQIPEKFNLILNRYYDLLRNTITNEKRVEQRRISSQRTNSDTSCTEIPYVFKREITFP